MGGAMSKRQQQRLDKLLALVDTLPQAAAQPAGLGHMALAVRRKAFAYYLNNHHNDGKVCLCAKAPPGRQQQLVRGDPQRYCVPAYLGSKGWVSLRLDLPTVDWGAVLERLVEAYRLAAPRKLAAEME